MRRTPPTPEDVAVEGLNEASKILAESLLANRDEPSLVESFRVDAYRGLVIGSGPDNHKLPNKRRIHTLPRKTGDV